MGCKWSKCPLPFTNPQYIKLCVFGGNIICTAHSLAAKVNTLLDSCKMQQEPTLFHTFLKTSNI